MRHSNQTFTGPQTLIRDVRRAELLQLPLNHGGGLTVQSECRERLKVPIRPTFHEIHPESAEALDWLSSSLVFADRTSDE